MTRGKYGESLFNISSSNRFFSYQLEAKDYSFTARIYSYQSHTCSRWHEVLLIIKAKFENFLKQTFKVKMLGQLFSFIGWEISDTATSIYLGQSTYAKLLIEHGNLTHCKPLNTPLPIRADISIKNHDKCAFFASDHERYRSLVGDLSYLVICTKPGISFAVSMMARQLHTPTERCLVFSREAQSKVCIWHNQQDHRLYNYLYLPFTFGYFF